MATRTRIALGSLVTPKDSRCGIYVNTHLGPGLGWENCYYYTGAIRVCEIPNRERPVALSRDLPLTYLGMVLEHNECKRYFMIKILTVTRFGAPLIGWVLEKDVDVIQ